MKHNISRRKIKSKRRSELEAAKAYHPAHRYIPRSESQHSESDCSDSSSGNSLEDEAEWRKREESILLQHRKQEESLWLHARDQLTDGLDPSEIESVGREFAARASYVRYRPDAAPEPDFSNSEGEDESESFATRSGPSSGLKACFSMSIKTGATAEAKVQAKAKAGARAAATPKAKPDAETTMNAQVKTEAGTRANAETKADAERKTDTEKQAEAKAKAKADANAEAKAIAAILKAIANAEPEVVPSKATGSYLFIGPESRLQ